MSIEVTCDDCGRDFRVNDANAGRTVRCKCGAAVHVPDDDDFEDDAPPRRSTQKRRKSKSGGDGSMIGVVIGGAFGLVALLIVGILVIRTGGSRDLPAPPATVQTTPSVSSTPNTTLTTPTVAPQQPATPSGAKGAGTTTPAAGTNPAAPANTNAKATQPAAVTQPWTPLESSFQVGHSGKDSKIAISPGGKFVAVDRVIHDSASGDEVWTVPAAFGGGDKNAVQAISPDGNVFAEADEAGQKLTIYLRDKEANENKLELPVPNGAAKLTFLQFATPKLVVAAFNAGANTRVAVYNVDKPKKAQKEFATEGFSTRTGAISGDGKFLAVASFQSLKVYDLVKGVSAATMAAPANGPQAFASCSGVGFSPDNEELAAVLGTGILIWSNRGKLIEEFGGVVSGNPFYKHSGLQYLADKSGFLVNGQDVFDRASKMVVWQLKQAMFYDHPAAVYDTDHILVSGGSTTNGQIAAVKIPRDELARATKAIADKVESVLAPGSQISIVYEIGEPRFSSRQEVTNQLHTALTARLAQFGIAVAENQPTTLKVVYTEAAGDTIEYSEGRGFGPPIPRPPGFPRSPFDKPGTKVVETKHNLNAVLLWKNDPRTWWSAKISQDAPQTLKGDANETNVRNGSFEMVKNRINGFDFPRFLPVDQNIPALPLKSDLGGL